MFKLFKKNKKLELNNEETSFEIELTASVLAYEVARIDGETSNNELQVLLSEIKKIAEKVNKSKEQVLNIVQEYSKNSVSFHDFIEDINNEYSKDEKLALIKFLWEIAYSDSILEVNEEKLIRRIADLINLKDIEVLKLKNKSKQLLD